MPERRRLRAAERRLVDPVLDQAIKEVRPLTRQVERSAARAIAELPEDLHHEAMSQFMNRWLNEVWQGTSVSLRRADEVV